MPAVINGGKGWHGQFCFCSGPRTGGSGEHGPPPTTALQKSPQQALIYVEINVRAARSRAVYRRCCVPMCVKNKSQQHIIMVWRFRREKAFFILFFFMEPVPGTQRHTDKKSRVNIRRSDWLGPNIKPHLSPKTDPTLKLSNYKATTQITYVFCTKAQTSTPFLVDSDFLHTFCAPANSITNFVFLFFFLLRAFGAY